MYRNRMSFSSPCCMGRWGADGRHGPQRAACSAPSERGAPATGVLTETTAELALALTFAAARRVVEADRFMRAGQYDGWLPGLFVGESAPRGHRD